MPDHLPSLPALRPLFHHLRCCWLLVLVLLALQPAFIHSVASAQTPLPPLLWFEDVSQTAGIVNNRQGDDRAIGQAWGDFDNDGWIDLYVTDSDGPNTLYRNLGDGTFAVANVAGSANSNTQLPTLLSGGAIFVDYDNDGWRDLYVLNWGPNVLFHNEQGLFVNVTAQAGVAGNANSQTASWGDYDQDGWLDLYVANWSCYPRCGRPTIGERDRLYHSNGDGTFTEVTDLLGTKTVGAGFVASFVDYDNDGDPDIYLVNDEFINPIGNILWRNDGPGCDGWCFTDVSQAAGANEKVMGMGLTTFDFDSDGLLDFYFSNAGPMTLLRNQGNGAFVNVASAAGVEAADNVGWGSVALDYDNDGWPDLYLAVMEKVGSDAGADQLFHNQGDGAFVLAENSGVDSSGRTLGVASADYNHDGWVDLVIGNHDAGYRLYRNLGAARANAHWLTLELIGATPINRDAVGARVFVTTPNGHRQLQQVISGASLGAGNELALHFGLGAADRAAKVEIIWPDNTYQLIENIPANRRLTLTYGVPFSPPAATWLRPTLIAAVLLTVVLLTALTLTIRRRRA